MSIIAAIDAALDGAALTLDGHQLVNLLSTIFWTVHARTPDGQFYHGIVRLRAATEPALP